MIIAPLDFETTGKDPEQCWVYEYGVSLYSTGHRRYFECASQLVSQEIKVSPKITEITGIQQSAIDHFSYDELNALTTIVDIISQAEAVIGHNIRSFDWPILERWAKKYKVVLPNVQIVDTFEDIPGVEPESLITMSAKAGFVFTAHSALADAHASMRLAEYHGIDEVVERAKVPSVIVQSLAPRTETNDENKEFKFRWHPGERIWWKRVKETDVQDLAQRVPFKIAVLDKEYLEIFRGK